MSETEERLQQLEDRLAVEHLLAEYITLMDAGDYAAYADLFTEDGELMFQNAHLKGSAAIREALLGASRAGPGGSNPMAKLRHMIANLLIRVDGDRAMSSGRWITMSPGADGRPVIGGTGAYQDTLRKVDGAWKFECRVITNDIPFIEVAALKW